MRKFQRLLARIAEEFDRAQVPTRVTGAHKPCFSMAGHGLPALLIALWGLMLIICQEYKEIVEGILLEPSGYPQGGSMATYRS